MWDENVVAEHDSVSNEDGTLTYTIKLHDDLYFSDGTQITAKNYMAFPLLMASPVAIAESAYGTACKESEECVRIQHIQNHFGFNTES